MINFFRKYLMAQMLYNGVDETYSSLKANLQFKDRFEEVFSSTFSKDNLMTVIGLNDELRNTLYSIDDFNLILVTKKLGECLQLAIQNMKCDVSEVRNMTSAEFVDMQEEKFKAFTESEEFMVTENLGIYIPKEYEQFKVMFWVYLHYQVQRNVPAHILLMKGQELPIFSPDFELYKYCDDLESNMFLIYLLLEQKITLRELIPNVYHFKEALEKNILVIPNYSEDFVDILLLESDKVVSISRPSYAKMVAGRFNEVSFKGRKIMLGGSILN